MAQISGQELIDRIEKGETLNLLDVREEIEYHTYNIGGQNIPLPALSKKLDQINYNKNDEIIVICKAGLRSETARLLLVQNGYHQVRNLTGGLMALQKISIKKSVLKK